MRGKTVPIVACFGFVNDARCVYCRCREIPREISHARCNQLSFLVPHTMADSLLEGVAAKIRKHNARTSARSATMSHKSAKGAFTCSMWHAHTRARPHAAQLCTCSRFARNSRWEPQLALRGRHCCNEGGLLSILAGWIDDRSSSTPTRAA